jgi:3-hydroxyisobutyrate dehydrogenase-like beta-hydroxyacid dehydrogenase
LAIEHIGILHPGQMGVSVAASAGRGGHQVYWASEGRSPETRRRAEQVGLHDLGVLARVCERCSVILSVCPPHAAETLADRVLACGFAGLYLDANAIAPRRAERIGRKMADAGASFVDGGIIGGPAWEPGRTWLYLSGQRSADVASLFSAGPLETEVIGDRPGKASALKMCFAANTKGTTALLCAVLAAAENLGVRAELERQWSRYEPGFAEEAAGRVRRVTAKAWRFAGEMDEIAATFADAGLPGEFHAAAAVLYRRMAHLRDVSSVPPLEAVLAALASGQEGS